MKMKKYFFTYLQIYAFDDVNPQAPVHVLIIPKIKDGLTGLSNVIFFNFIRPQTRTNKF